MSVVVTRGSSESLGLTLAGLRDLLPHMRPLPDGWIHINVLEHTLSKHGTVQLRMMPGQTDIEVIRTYREPEPFPDLESALRHIQDKHWYQCAPGFEVPDEED